MSRTGNQQNQKRPTKAQDWWNSFKREGLLQQTVKLSRHWLFHIWSHQKHNFPWRLCTTDVWAITELFHCLPGISSNTKSWPWPTECSSRTWTVCSWTDSKFHLLTSYLLLFLFDVWLCIIFCFVWHVWSQAKCVVKRHWRWNPGIPVHSYVKLVLRLNKVDIVDR